MMLANAAPSIKMAQPMIATFERDCWIVEYACLLRRQARRHIHAGSRRVEGKDHARQNDT